MHTHPMDHWSWRRREVNLKKPLRFQGLPLTAASVSSCLLIELLQIAVWQVVWESGACLHQCKLLDSDPEKRGGLLEEPTLTDSLSSPGGWREITVCMLMSISSMLSSEE